MQKYILLLFIITLLSNTVKSQLYTELGLSYAFSTEKANLETNKYSNVYTGYFYRALMGYSYKGKIGFEVCVNYKPNPTLNNLINEPKTIIIEDKISFYKSSFFTVLPRFSYNIKIKKLNITPFIGVSFSNLNNYNYTFNNYNYSTGNNNVITNSTKYNYECYYKYNIQNYNLNSGFKINYKINDFYSVYFETYFNIFGVNNENKLKIIFEKERTETYNINTNPNTVVVENEIYNQTSDYNVSIYDYYNIYVIRKNYFDKLFFTNIGLRYTFGKKEGKEK